MRHCKVGSEGRCDRGPAANISRNNVFGRCVANADYFIRVLTRLLADAAVTYHALTCLAPQEKMEILVATVGTVLSMFLPVKQKKPRQDPLRNTEKVSVEINSESSLDGLVAHLPESYFIKNMANAVEMEMNELKAKWTTEKATFELIWNGFSPDQRKTLVQKLLDELKFSIEIYSDTNELLRILCPKLREDYLLDSKVQEIPLTGAAIETDSRPTILKFILAAQNKTDIKYFCLPLLIVNAERVERDVDPNGAKQTDSAVAEQVDLFLRALQHLCVIKFAKQLLLRYKAEPQMNGVVRTIKKLAPLTVFAVLAGFLVYLLDKYGFLGAVMWNYKSPLGN